MNDISGVRDLNVGDIYNITDGGTITVLEIVSSTNVLIRHNDRHGHTCRVQAIYIATGGIKNPYTPTLYGRGYIGFGQYVCSINGQHTREYRVWNAIFQRCYNPTVQVKQPQYIGCTVDERWWNFQNFASWYCNSGYVNLNYDIDKDLLIRGNRVYSPDVCLMLPREINSAIANRFSDNGLPNGVSATNGKYVARASFGGKARNFGTYETTLEASMAYNKARQQHLLNIAEKWRNHIEPRAYKALLVYAQET